jgi:hypothetical protein
VLAGQRRARRPPVPTEQAGAVAGQRVARVAGASVALATCGLPLEALGADDLGLALGLDGAAGPIDTLGVNELGKPAPGHDHPAPKLVVRRRVGDQRVGSGPDRDPEVRGIGGPTGDGSFHHSTSYCSGDSSGRRPVRVRTAALAALLERGVDGLQIGTSRPPAA